MNTKLLGIAAVLGSALCMTACDVNQTQEGELPDVDVSVKGGQLPEYEVEVADIDVGSKEVAVTVPDVDVDVSTKKATITVPDVDITMPKDK